MIQMWDENVPNLDVCGLMARDRQEFGDCPCEGCEGIIFEAWERMTYGGVGPNNEIGEEHGLGWYVTSKRTYAYYVTR